MGFGDVDEGDVGAAEEFFHIAGVAAGVFGVVLDAIFELDGANGAKGAFIAEDEIDGFVVDKAVGGIAVLGADFVAKEGRKTNFGDDVEFLAKEIVEHLEALLLGANHEMFAGAVFEAVDGLALAATGSNADENRDKKQ